MTRLTVTRPVRPAAPAAGAIGAGVAGQWHDGRMHTEQSTALVGREADLEALRGAFADVQAGRTRTVAFGGEAGIGKTRLVQEFLDELRPEPEPEPVAGPGRPDRPLVLRGQSIDLDSDAPPYTPVVAALRELAAGIGEQAFLEAAGQAGETLFLLLLLPELGLPRYAVAPPEAGASSRLSANSVSANSVYDAVAGTLEAAARVHPLVFVIEDLHWADQGTLGLLRYLIRVIERDRILFVLTFRSDELGRGRPLRAWLPELDRNRRAERRELARLTRAQVRQMAMGILGASPDEREIGLVHERTDGVPFFVEELIGCEIFSGAESVPETLRGILLARYELLNENTKRIMRLLAAGGVRVEHELLALVCDDSAEDIDAAAGEAVNAGVLVALGTAYAFRHALVREAVHDQLLPGEWVRFHTRYAEALESGRSEASPDATAVSYHWMAAHNLRKAFASSVTAMVQAHRSYAFASAARMGERAIELWDQIPDAEELAGRSRVDLLAETSYILRNAGESERAIALIDEAIAGSSSADPERYARMLRNKASYLANIGQIGSVALLREALDVLADQPPSVLRANVLGELAARLMLEARFDEAVGTANDAYAQAAEVGSGPRMSVAANIRGFSRLCAGAIEAGLADLELAGELAGDNDSARLRFWVNQSDALHLLGRFDDAVRVAEEGVERARQRGVERTSGAMLLSNLIGPLAALGQTQRADELLDRALELDPPIGYRAHLQRLKLHSNLRAGDAPGAERMLRGWRGALNLQVRIDAQSRLGLAAVAAEIALAQGDLQEAWREVSVLFEPEHRSFPAYDLPLLAIGARVIAAARAGGSPIERESGQDAGVGAEPGAGPARTGGGPGRILDRLEEKLRAALAAASPWPTAPALLAVFDAELSGPGRTGTDPEAWKAAVAASAVPEADAQLAPYAAFRLAEAFATGGDRSSARGWAETARGDAERIGLGLVADQAARLLRRIGPARPGASDLSAEAQTAALLTERERQVLDLLAQGLSNRQIAERLFISVKTASVHVSNILRKTGAVTRTEAAYLSHRRHLAIAALPPRPSPS
ncbi:DNA-binding CsgD family transcriptional regulator [Cryobacterium sp. MP_M5]|uniref:helix-turn-helix transcriptional regulator n=1 Tax=unclassified Cryobacterium TaxID=2649013 RepID=UPI0018C9E6A8|nr:MULTISPECIES: helix-turn-helix transcriptional regulator [unclassified Cryobacterium]MBG6058076.1 DNA-binding CsgD family transcriptional regulator [Cryobacterium sp. MP_M3]MEC5176680.1 DNA-binding CsgD family transcriptional regulator [Cryobacterium sp. MP_M5]